MDNGSYKRKNLKFDKVEELSQKLCEDYNELLNGELYFARYGMSHVLKKYAGLSEDFKIHALFEHGVIFTENTTGTFRAHEYLPSIVPSRYRVEILKKEHSFNGAYAIGPYIHYADSLLSKEELIEEKERLGKTLLVFPSHSIEGLVSNFSFDDFCNKIKQYSENYDSVRICMYYKDIVLKRHIPYQKKDFEVVTVGHFNDYNFIPRLKSIIKTSDMTMSNEIGSHVGYCLYLGKPHYLTKLDDVSHKGEKNGENTKAMVRNEEIALKIKNKCENVVKITQLFSNFEEKITNEQYDFISCLWGFDQIKTNDELKSMFLKINENYSWIKYYYSGLKRLKSILLERHEL